MGKCLYLLCIVAFTSISVRSAPFIHGEVQNAFGYPIKDADIVYGNSYATQTDTKGEFIISSESTPIHNYEIRSNEKSRTFGVRANKKRLFLTKIKGADVAVALYNCRGQLVFYKSEDRVSTETIQWNINNTIASGFHVLWMSIDGKQIRIPFITIDGNEMVFSDEKTILATNTQPLSKRRAAHTIGISADGYASRSFDIENDKAFGLHFTLYKPSQTIPSSVTVSENNETKSLNFPTAHKEGYILKWADSSKVRSYCTPSTHTTKDITYPLVNLDNTMMRVSVSPSTGSRVLYAIDKTRSTPRQLFATPGSNDLLSGKMFGNLGGLKPNFPYAENSCGLVTTDGKLGYAAGYFTKKHPDGAVSVIMNMRFDYNQLEQDCNFFGKYGDRSLVTVVTLYPGHADFSIEYSIDNPNPIRRNDRFWNSAIMPFSPSSWIYPVKRGIQHCAKEVWDMEAQEWGFSSTKSYFALYPQYGFCGAYYDNAKASHLRIGEPEIAPGMKIYDHPDIPEIWSSSNVLFEAPHDFIRPFEPFSLPLSYYLTQQLGKVTFANSNVAISTSGKSFKLVTPVKDIISVYDYNASTSPIHKDVASGPSTIVSGTFSNGLRVVSWDGTELCNVKLPLEYIDNIDRFNEVKAMADRSGCDNNVSSATLDASRKYNIELEGITVRKKEPSTLGALLAIKNVRASDDPDILLSLANAAYRCGGFDIVGQYLEKVGTRRPKQTAYLKALMDWEKGRTANFDNTPLEGNYFKALQSIGAGNKSQAITYLNELIEQRPRVLRPRIVRAYLTGELKDALEVYKRVPGSIELWVVLKELGFPNASANLDGLLKQNVMAKTRADDFLKEIKNGTWRHERRYEYDKTWFEKVDLPAFPQDLAY